MAKLNYYDVDAVKAFTLDMLVENQELRAEAKFMQDGRDYWLKKSEEARVALEAAQEKAATVVGYLKGLKDTLDHATVTDETVIDVITKALSCLEGGDQK